MVANSFLGISISQRFSNIHAHKHNLIINLASTNLAENFTCKNLNVCFHNFELICEKKVGIFAHLPGNILLTSTQGYTLLFI